MMRTNVISCVGGRCRNSIRTGGMFVRILVVMAMGMVMLGGRMSPAVLVVDALEATFTHADGEDGRPLPLSQNLRDQIGELDRIISASENPEETLRMVAESNQMDPNELVQMINHNRRDQQGYDDVSQSNNSFSLSRKILSSLFQLVFVAPFRKIPPRYWILLPIALYITIQAPRTGLEFVGPDSSSPRWTTLLEPPSTYLHSSMERHYQPLFDHPTTQINDNSSNLSQRLQLLQSQTKTTTATTVTKKNKKKEAQKNNHEDGVQVYKDLSIPKEDTKKKKKKKAKKNSNTQQQVVISAKYNVDIKDLMSLLNKDDTNEKEEDKIANVHVAMSQLMMAARTIFSSRRISEYTSSSSYKTNIVTCQDDDESAVWILPQLGRLNRYAIQPLTLTCEKVKEMNSNEGQEGIIENVESCFIGYTVVSNGNSLLKDGTQLDFCCTWTKDDTAQVRVTLAFPNKTTMIEGEQILSNGIDVLCQSISKSIALQAKQTLTRKMQSRTFQTHARARATEKRHLRYDKMVKLEDMAEKRRRRWQRNNPDAGHYRPSGVRQLSPKNC
mmetsp:Transcript_1844/g.1754  ORF Transcript_1844/g.1754 Transcript_1844/m.1754 type:complete len:556 (-) Transcript_1844:30-1697(-)